MLGAARPFGRGRPGHLSGMGDYERSTTVRMPVDDLFEYLSRIENLPKYMSRMTEARHVTGDEVHVEARIEPADGAHDEVATSGEDGERTVGGEAWFRIDADHRKLAWGSQGPHDYHGELEVAQGGSGATVVVRLHTLHDDADAIEDGLARTLANIEQLAG
jgi:hypothetical protein